MNNIYEFNQHEMPTIELRDSKFSTDYVVNEIIFTYDKS